MFFQTSGLVCYRPRTKYDGRLCFHRCVSVQLSGWGVFHKADQGAGYPIPGPGGVPHLADGEEGTPSQVSRWGGISCSRSRWGVPNPAGLDGVPPCPGLDRVPPIRRQSSLASTCYVEGGMPLTFTQEDFLVHYYFVHRNLEKTNVT